MNTYATLDDLKAEQEISVSTYDARLLRYLEAASRYVDDECRRRFYSKTESRYFDGMKGSVLLLDDYLSLTALVADSELDGTYDGESWVADSDYWTWPDNEWPKVGVRATGFGDYSFREGARRYKATATWGFGDGMSATPYTASGVTVTAATAVATTVTVSAEGTIKAGHTLLVGTEQIYVTAATSDGTMELTVERGVNGTTAAVHTAASASIYQWPERIWRAVLVIAGEMWSDGGSEHLEAETIGNYQYRVLSAAKRCQRNLAMLSFYTKGYVE